MMLWVSAVGGLPGGPSLGGRSWLWICRNFPSCSLRSCPDAQRTHGACPRSPSRWAGILALGGILIATQDERTNPLRTLFHIPDRRQPSRTKACDSADHLFHQEGRECSGPFQTTYGPTIGRLALCWCPMLLRQPHIDAITGTHRTLLQRRGPSALHFL